MAGLRVLQGRVLTDGRELGPCRIELADGRIARVEPAAAVPDADLSAGDGWIVPGLIDLQVNGAGGVDLSSAPPDEGVGAVARTLVRHGVTAFCPTLISSFPDAILDRLPAFVPSRHRGGATSLGAHVEGPFVSPEHSGAHDRSVLRLSDSVEVDRWLALAPPAIVTLAPELPGARELIAGLTAAGVLVSLGHSGADAETTRAALAAGARMGTHLFNQMAPLHHRRPGIVGALLASEATLGLIVDGVHVDPLVVDLVVRAAGPGRIALVSDAAAPAGAPPGRYALGDQDVTSDGRTVRRDDGTLAGSAATLDACLRCARDALPWLPPAEVVRMATEVPARALGGAVAARKGRVAPGRDADLVVLGAEWRVRATVIEGEIVYQRDG